MPSRPRRSTRRRTPGFATQALHAGQAPDPTTGAVMQPIYQVSTYRQPSLDAGWAYDYARTINPTRRALERNLTALEGGLEGRCFASGMSAIAAVMNLLRSGDHVVVSRNVYGGTYRLFEGLLRQFGLSFAWVDTTVLREVEAAITPATRMIFVETPTNPVLGITDLAGVVRLARRRRIRVVVDNTFMSPYFQRPLDFGVDIVVHSTTKYLNGHSDSVGGTVIVARKDDAERLAWLQNAAGAILSPMDSFLVLRGVKTLPLRMQRHDASGRQVAAWLVGQRKIERVHYPGLRSHPQHALAKRQMSGFGGMISFDLGTLARARKFLGSLELCALAESLGGVETLISHPVSMTHGSVPKKERERIGVTDGLVRISVGLEDVDDLVADLRQALARI